MDMWPPGCWVLVELAKEFSKPALCCNRQAEEEWAVATNRLAGAGRWKLALWLTLSSSCLLLQRGFYPQQFLHSVWQ
jgi:hypothetical protein